MFCKEFSAEVFNNRSISRRCVSREKKISTQSENEKLTDITLPKVESMTDKVDE